LKARTLLSLALKILGIKYAMDALVGLPQVVYLIRVYSLQLSTGNSPLEDNKYWAVVNVAIIIFMLAVSLFIIFKSERIAGLFCKSEEAMSEPVPSPEVMNFLLAVSLKIIGVLTLIDSVHPLSRLFALGWTYKGSDFKYFDPSSMQTLTSNIMFAVLYIGIGLFLILRTDKICSLIMGKPSAPSGAPAGGDSEG